MENLMLEYELSQYSEIKMISKNKVYIVSHNVTGQLYIKKILKKENLKIYESLKGLKNKNRAQVIDFFLKGENLIVIEELVNGRTVENILMNGEIKREEAIRIAIGICDGLLDIHNMDKQIVHRDLKPANIMIASDGLVKIIDFDAARVFKNLSSRDTTIIGTAEYASPEQFGFAQTDNRSDIYSIGVLLNYMILKKYPIEQVVKGDVGNIINKAIQIDRNNRYKNVRELKNDLLESIGVKNIEKLPPKQQIKVNLIKKKEEKKQDNYKNDYDFKKTNTIKSKIKFIVRKIIRFDINKIWQWACLIFWYSVAIYGFSDFIKMHKMEDFTMSIYMFILPSMIFGDGFGINKYIPLIGSYDWEKRVTGRVIYFFVLTLIAGFIMEL